MLILPFVVFFQVENVSIVRAIAQWVHVNSSGNEKKILSPEEQEKWETIHYCEIHINRGWITPHHQHQCEHRARNNFFYCSIMWIMRNSRIRNLWRKHLKKNNWKMFIYSRRICHWDKIASIRRAEETFCEKIHIRCSAWEWLVILWNNICNVYHAPNSRRKCLSETKKRVLSLCGSLEKSEEAFALLVNTSCVEWTKNTWALKSVKGQSQRGKGRCEHRQTQS